MTIAHKIVENILKDEAQSCFENFDVALKIKTYPIISEAAKQIASTVIFEAKDTPSDFNLQEKIYNSFPPQTQKAIDFVIEKVAEYGTKNFSNIIEDAEVKYAIVDDSLKEYFGQAITAKLYESNVL
jgi:16S rRNA U1498 N3-methylase RsmE